MTDAVLEENADGIVTLTLNRPEQRNPISDDDVLETLIAALARLDADNATRAIIITGAGSAFSSGGNLKKMGASGGLNDPLPAQTRLNYRRGIQRLPLLIEAMEVPPIAAVNGPAVGAGCDLACMCDLRIAGESARFAESFVKVGIVPGDGGAWFLPRVVGFSKACEMALTGDAIDARRPHRRQPAARRADDAAPAAPGPQRRPRQPAGDVGRDAGACPCDGRSPRSRGGPAGAAGPAFHRPLTTWPLTTGGRPATLRTGNRRTGG